MLEKLAKKKFTKEHRKNLSISHMGYIPSIETRKKLSCIAIERGFGKWMLGKKISEEARRKRSEYGKNHPNSGWFKKGIIPWLKGTKGLMKPNKGSFKKGDKRFKNPSRELIRKRLCKRVMSGLEVKADRIIRKYNLPYKFVGNGKFFIENKNPDFINVNGKKIAIEVYYKKHKEEFQGGVDNWIINRKNIFSKYGWEILFFDETKVNEELFIKSL